MIEVIIYLFDAIIGYLCILHCSNYVLIQFISFVKYLLLFVLCDDSDDIL